MASNNQLVDILITGCSPNSPQNSENIDVIKAKDNKPVKLQLNLDEIHTASNDSIT